MKTIFGVNSIAPINRKLKNGYTMYDWVMRQNGFPAFCMRTLCGEDKITAEEIEFLKAKDCKIGLVVRDFTETQLSASDGKSDALNVVKAAKELCIPSNRGIAIFVEIKPEYSVNHNWMISFAYTLASNGFTPGFIGNTDSSKNFNFDRQCSHFIQATKNVDCLDTVIAATEPKLDKAPLEWAPYCPSALEPEDIKLWCCGTTTFDALQVENVYANDEKVLEKMW